MDWGYYCRTCGQSSEAIFDEPRRTFEVFRTFPTWVEELEKDQAFRLPTVEIRAFRYLAEHEGHDLWAECENGVVRLSPFDAPCSKLVALPQRFRVYGGAPL